MTLVYEHRFRDGLGEFNTWTGLEVDESLVETGSFGLRLHVNQVAGVWKGAEVVLPTPLTYGRVVVRCRLPKGSFKGLALLWPADGNWPPEIDFYEIGAMWSERERCNQTLHWGFPHEMRQTHYFGDFSQWHKIGVKWSPGVLRYICDGKLEQIVRSEHVPSLPMKLHLKSSPGNMATKDLGMFEVDWVRVFD